MLQLIRGIRLVFCSLTEPILPAGNDRLRGRHVLSYVPPRDLLGPSPPGSRRSKNDAYPTSNVHTDEEPDVLRWFGQDGQDDQHRIRVGVPRSAGGHSHFK